MRDDRRLLLENCSTIDTAEIPVNAIENAVAKQLEDFAAAWGSLAWDLVRELNRQRFRIVMRDYTSDQDGVAAHWRLGGHPTATVYVRDILRLENGSWIKGTNSVSASISHEVVELLADPIACYYVDGPDDWMYALEVADPVQDDYYNIDEVAVSNFTFPDYWNPWAKKTRLRKLDQMGKVTRPFEVRAGGYLVRYKGSRRSYVYGPSFASARRRVKESKPNGRTRRRLEQVERVGGARIELPPLGQVSATRTRRRVDAGR
jgi:hypothetical protein